MANSADPDQVASQKPTDLDLHCLQMQGISGFSRTRVKSLSEERVQLSIFCKKESNLISTVFNPSLAEHDMPCFSKQCRSRSVGF